MTLRLSVVSEHGARLGAHSTKVFGVHGGSIGRGTDNEWILPDPERYLSGKHARIDCRAGSYILVDTSSNGTYVNGSQVPLGKSQDYPLKHGDHVRLGEYELQVSIDEGNDFPPDQSAIVAYDGKYPSSAARKSTANDLGEALDLSELLDHGDRSAIDSGVRPRNAYGETIRAQSGAETEASGTPWHMMTRPLKVTGKIANVPATATGGAAAAGMAIPPGTSGAHPPRPLALFDGDGDAGLAAFCRGAGLDPRTIAPDTRGAVMQLAGQLLREAVMGLMDLNQGHNEIRHRFRIPLPAEEGPESPLNFSHGVGEALVRLLTTSSSRAGSVEAVRDNFRELKAHNAAALGAMRAAFEEFLERVDPKELEERFDRSAKRGVFGTQSRAKYWDLYAEMFAGLAQRPDDGFPHSFTETFAKAYQDRLRKLVPPRRRPFGAERGESSGPDDRAVGDP